MDVHVVSVSTHGCVGAGGTLTETQRASAAPQAEDVKLLLLLQVMDDLCIEQKLNNGKV